MSEAPLCAGHGGVYADERCIRRCQLWGYCLRWPETVADDEASADTEEPK